jgi:hypothetical protein
MKRIIYDGLSLRRRVSFGSKMNRNEGFFGEGTVEVQPFQMIDGEKVYQTDLFSKHNLIVAKGREGLIDLLIGIKPKHLKYIRWGKGGAPAFPSGDPLIPYDVVDTDLTTASFLVDKLLNTPTRISPTQVSYSETLISDEVNSDVNEAAMMFEDQTTFDRIIFARITFPTIRLTSDHGNGIDLRWVFNFSRAEEI